jgi:hypothetical protein
MDGVCITAERNEKCIKNFCWKYRTKEATRKTKHRWEDIIRMDLLKIGWEVVDWMHLDKDWDQRQDPVNMVMNLRFL